MENKGADQLRSYCEADLRLCFITGKNPVFSRCGSNLFLCSGTAVEHWLEFIEGLRGDYSDLDTCRDPAMMERSDYYDKITHSITVLVKKLKGETVNEDVRMLDSLQGLRDWIVMHQNMEERLSGMELEVTKQKFKVLRNHL